MAAELAGEFAPPDSFYSDLAVALAARREPDELELAAAEEGEGIFAEQDTSGPAPWAMLPDPWSHTMRNPAHRAHTLGHQRQHRGVTDAASALARRAVA
jgi:hypothetical protein